MGVCIRDPVVEVRFPDTSDLDFSFAAGKAAKKQSRLSRDGLHVAEPPRERLDFCREPHSVAPPAKHAAERFR